MQFRTAIKWLHRVVTTLLLMLVIGFLYLNHHSDRRAGDELQHTYKLNDRMWLYITENRGGGATVPIVYRYYLAGDIKGRSDEIVKRLNKDEIPFLEGSGTIANIHAGDNNQVNVTYSGNVFSLNNTTDYSYDNQNITARIQYLIN